MDATAILQSFGPALSLCTRAATLVSFHDNSRTDQINRLTPKFAHV